MIKFKITGIDFTGDHKRTTQKRCKNERVLTIVLRSFLAANFNITFLKLRLFKIWFKKAIPKWLKTLPTQFPVLPTKDENKKLLSTNMKISYFIWVFCLECGRYMVYLRIWQRKKCLEAGIHESNFEQSSPESHPFRVIQGCIIRLVNLDELQCTENVVS